MKGNEANSSSEPNVPEKILLFVFIVILFLIQAITSFFRKKRSKSELAKEYGVSVKVLMKWVKMFCPDEYVEQYVGTKKKKIPVYRLHQAIGNPKRYPTYKGQPIISKSDLERAFFVGSTTLLQCIRSIADPMKEISMSYEQYRSLKRIPPRHMERIVAYMIKNGHNATRIETVSALTHYDRKMVDFYSDISHIWEKS